MILLLQADWRARAPGAIRSWARIAGERRGSADERRRRSRGQSAAARPSRIRARRAAVVFAARSHARQRRRATGRRSSSIRWRSPSCARCRLLDSWWRRLCTASSRTAASASAELIGLRRGVATSSRPSAGYGRRYRHRKRAPSRSQTGTTRPRVRRRQDRQSAIPRARQARAQARRRHPGPCARPLDDEHRLRWSTTPRLRSPSRRAGARRRNA